MSAPHDDTFTRTIQGMGKLVDQLTPWLLDLGGWIFGAMIAFNLLLLASLLTVGPVDAAVLIATASVALALPLAVAGFLVLRLLEDVKKVRLEDVAAQSFLDAGLAVPGSIQSPETRESILKQRTRTVLIYSYSLLTLTVLLTGAGITGALWHMAWWIAIAFLAMVSVSQLVFIQVMRRSPSRRMMSSDHTPTPPQPRP